MKDGLRINYIHHNKQVVEKPALFGEGVAFFSGEEKEAPDYEQGNCSTTSLQTEQNRL